MAYIYKIINDINQKIYIGKTEFSIEKRFKEHCKDSKKIRCEKRPLYSAMNKYGIENFHIELIEETNNPEEREKYWIEYYGSFKYGYNATKGGDGKSYINRELVLQNYQQLQNQKEVAKLMNISVDIVSLILSEFNIVKKTSQEINKEKYGKIVSAYDKKTGKFIKSFSSMTDAGKWLIENNYSNCKLTTIRTHISEVVRGKRKSAAGFTWK